MYPNPPAWSAPPACGRRCASPRQTPRRVAARTDAWREMRRLLSAFVHHLFTAAACVSIQLGCFFVTSIVKRPKCTVLCGWTYCGRGHHAPGGISFKSAYSLFCMYQQCMFLNACAVICHLGRWKGVFV